MSTNRNTLDIHNINNTATYRITLNPKMIAKIVFLARKEDPLTQEGMEVLGKFAPFLAKIENLAITPAYITEPPKPSTLESLGGAHEKSDETIAHDTKEEYWFYCYTKYISKPEGCTVAELQGAREYKYLNDLMTTEEVNEFESVSL